MHGIRVVVVVAMTAAVSVGVVVSLAQAPVSVRDGIYTTAQAEQGRAIYDTQCVSCHGELSAFVPEMAALLADHTFRSRWEGRSLGELFSLILEEMPQDAPGTLSVEQTADLIAYLLSGNRLPAGGAALSDDLDRLNQIAFTP
jgi:mono/diheme cytochrome c family protein